MTLVIACITHDFVVLAADRRLTNSKTSEVMDTTTNKIIVISGVGIMGFTGLGRINGEYVDRWVCEALADIPAEGDPLGAIRDSATEAFKRMPRLPSVVKRHAFFVAGFARLRRDPEKTPVPIMTA